MSETISRNLEGVHIVFFRHITGQRAVRQEDGTWRQVTAEKVLEKAGTQYLGTYVDRRQATVVEWVAPRPILKVCDNDTYYKGGGRRCEQRWRKMATIKQLSDTLKEILRRQGSGIGNPEGVAGTEETGMQRSQKMGQGVMGIGMLGRRQGTPRW